MMVMILMITESIVTRIMFIMSLKVMMIALIREHDAGDDHVDDQQEDGPLANDLSRPDGWAELRCPRLHRQL